MANKLQIKRTSVTGRTPNTTNSGNAAFIDTGELALNITDGKMFSSDGTVYFEIGANLQNISVASNTSVANLNVSATTNHANNQVVNAKMKGYSLKGNVLGSVSGATTVDLTLGNYVTATTGGATTWTFSNPIASGDACGFILELTNGGSATQTWPASVTKWPGGTAPTLTSAGVDVLVFITDDAGTTWRGVACMLDSK